MSPAEIAERPSVATQEFADGEWHWEPTPEAQALIDEALRSVELHGTVDGETFFDELFAQNAEAREAERAKV